VQKRTKRIPVDIPVSPGGVEAGGVLTVMNRTLDQERILPAVAGGLVLMLAAAHLLRFLNA
jgi:hypothetical protein